MWEGVSRRGLVGRKARVVWACSKRKMNPAASSHACSKTVFEWGGKPGREWRAQATRLGEGRPPTGIYELRVQGCGRGCP